jgi:hypothetical protein
MRRQLRALSRRLRLSRNIPVASWASGRSKIVSPSPTERGEGAKSYGGGYSSRFELRRLVLVEESGRHIWINRLRSRARRGERPYGPVPKNRGKNLTL